MIEMWVDLCVYMWQNITGLLHFRVNICFYSFQLHVHGNNFVMHIPNLLSQQSSRTDVPLCFRCL